MTKIEIFGEDSDQSPSEMFLNGNVITEEDALEAVDGVLENLENTSDLAQVDATLKSLLGMQKISGMSLAKLLWGTKNWWVAHGMDTITGDAFEDRMDSIHRLKRIVIDRYIALWDKYETGSIPEGIRARSIKDQIAISQTIEQGYEIGTREWKKLEDASNNSEVLDILRGIKGKPPRKSMLKIYEERDGSLVGWDKEGRHVLGWLNVDEEDDPVIHKGLERIRNNAGILRR